MLASEPAAVHDPGTVMPSARFLASFVPSGALTITHFRLQHRPIVYDDRSSFAVSATSQGQLQRREKSAHSSGFVHRRPGNRAKSRSVVWRMPPYCIVSAASWASEMSTPGACPSTIMRCNSGQWSPPGSSSRTFGCCSQRSTISTASSRRNRSPGSRGFVMIRKNAPTVCHGNPMGVACEKTSSTQARGFL